MGGSTSKETARPSAVAPGMRYAATLAEVASSASSVLYATIGAAAGASAIQGGATGRPAAGASATLCAKFPASQASKPVVADFPASQASKSVVADFPASQASKSVFADFPASQASKSVLDPTVYETRLKGIIKDREMNWAELIERYEWLYGDDGLDFSAGIDKFVAEKKYIVKVGQRSVIYVRVEDLELRTLLLDERFIFYELPERYERRFGQRLEFGNSLLHFIDTHPYLYREGIHVTYRKLSEAERQEAIERVSQWRSWTDRQRLKFLLPRHHSLHYGKVQVVYKQVFGEELPCTYLKCLEYITFISDYSVAYNFKAEVAVSPVPASGGGTGNSVPSSACLANQRAGLSPSSGSSSSSSSHNTSTSGGSASPDVSVKSNDTDLYHHARLSGTVAAENSLINTSAPVAKLPPPVAVSSFGVLSPAASKPSAISTVGKPSPPVAAPTISAVMTGYDDAAIVKFVPFEPEAIDISLLSDYFFFCYNRRPAFSDKLSVVLGKFSSVTIREENLKRFASRKVQPPQAKVSTVPSSGSEQKRPVAGTSSSKNATKFKGATPQSNVVTLLREMPHMQLSKLPNEYLKKFGKQLLYDCKLKVWLEAIPEVKVNSAKGTLSVVTAAKPALANAQVATASKAASAIAPVAAAVVVPKPQVAPEPQVVPKSIPNVSKVASVPSSTKALNASKVVPSTVSTTPNTQPMETTTAIRTSDTFECRIRDLVQSGIITLDALYNQYQQVYKEAPRFVNGSLQQAVKQIPGLQIKNSVVSFLPDDKESISRMLTDLVEHDCTLLELCHRFRERHACGLPLTYTVKEYVDFAATLNTDGRRVWRTDTLIPKRVQSPPSAGTVSPQPGDTGSVSNSSSMSSLVPSLSMTSLVSNSSSRDRPASTSGQLSEADMNVIRMLRRNPVKLSQVPSLYMETYKTPYLYESGKLRSCLLALPGVTISSNGVVSADRTVPLRGPLESHGPKQKDAGSVSNSSSMASLFPSSSMTSLVSNSSSRDRPASTSGELSVPDMNVIRMLRRNPVKLSQVPSLYMETYQTPYLYESGQLRSCLLALPGVTISSSDVVSADKTVPLRSSVNSHRPKQKGNGPSSSEVERILELIRLEPSVSMGNLKYLYQKRFGSALTFTGQLKDWLRGVSRISIQSNGQIIASSSCQVVATPPVGDVSEDAEVRIQKLLKKLDWLPLDMFTAEYRRLYNINANESWVKSRQRTIEGLALLNGKVRYRVLDKEYVKYVIHLAYLCGGLPTEYIPSFFEHAYGVRLPASAINDLPKAFSQRMTQYDSTPFACEVEVLDQLKPLSKPHRRLLLYLMQEKIARPIFGSDNNVFKRIGIDVPPTFADAEATCRALPGVSVLDQRVKFFGWKCEDIQKLLSRLVHWCGAIWMSDIPAFYSQMFGMTFYSETPLNDLVKRCSGIVIESGVATSTLNLSADFIRQSKNGLLVARSMELTRLIDIIKSRPGLTIAELTKTYHSLYHVGIMSPSIGDSLKAYLKSYEEFVVAGDNVYLHGVVASKSLTPLPPTATCITTSENTPDDRIIRERLSGILVAAPNKSMSSGQLLNAYSSLFGPLVYTRGKLGAYLKSLGFCFVDDAVHMCSQNLVDLLEEQPRTQLELTAAFQEHFDREPCYDGDFAQFLEAIGCTRFEAPVRQEVIFFHPRTDVLTAQENLRTILRQTNGEISISTLQTLNDTRYSRSRLQRQVLVAVLCTMANIQVDWEKWVVIYHEISPECMEDIRTLVSQLNEKMTLTDLVTKFKVRYGRPLTHCGSLKRALTYAKFDVQGNTVYPSNSDNRPANNAASSHVSSTAQLTIRELPRMTDAIKEILRDFGAIPCEELEHRFYKAMRTNVDYSTLGCSSFEDFLKTYVCDEGVRLSEGVVCLSAERRDLQAGDASSTSRSDLPKSPSIPSRLAEVLACSGYLEYPTELQNRFQQVTGDELVIEDSNAFLLKMMHTQCIVVESDGRGAKFVTAQKETVDDAQPLYADDCDEGIGANDDRSASSVDSVLRGSGKSLAQGVLQVVQKQDSYIRAHLHESVTRVRDTERAIDQLSSDEVDSMERKAGVLLLQGKAPRGVAREGATKVSQANCIAENNKNMPGRGSLEWTMDSAQGQQIRVRITEAGSRSRTSAGRTHTDETDSCSDDEPWSSAGDSDSDNDDEDSTNSNSDEHYLTICGKQTWRPIVSQLLSSISPGHAASSGEMSECEPRGDRRSSGRDATNDWFQRAIRSAQTDLIGIRVREGDSDATLEQIRSLLDTALRSSKANYSDNDGGCGAAAADASASPRSPGSPPAKLNGLATGEDPSDRHADGVSEGELLRTAHLLVSNIISVRERLLAVSEIEPETSQ